MKHLKTYEFFKKIKKMLEPKETLIPTEFNNQEIEKLEELGFIYIIQDTAEYVSLSSDLKITIIKHMEEVVPGYAETYFTILKNDENITPKGKQKFDDIVKIAKDTIPEIDIYSNQYNL
jgi:hypothetical protein